MICPGCRAGEHDVCTGKGQCDCQHRKPRRAVDPSCGAWDAEVGGLCGVPGRLYACGWRCEAHKP